MFFSRHFRKQGSCKHYINKRQEKAFIWEISWWKEKKAIPLHAKSLITAPYHLPFTEIREHKTKQK